MPSIAAPAPGTVFGGKWRLVHPLAEGGMGVVWVGEHVTIEQPVAVKLLHVHEGLEQREECIERFEREGRVAAALSRRSRHIVPVVDLGISPPWAYLVSELVEEGTLDDAIFRAAIAPSSVAVIVAQTAKALAVVHAA